MTELPFYEVDQYRHLRSTLGSFGVSSIRNAAFDLFYALGYATKKQLPDISLTPKTLISVFQCPRHLDEERAIIDDWESIDFLFQFTQEDLYQDSQHHHGENGINSFLFFAIDLKKKNYSPQQLEDITHAINYCFVTPVIILYRYGKHIALGMAKKRPNKLFSDLDVVEAVEVVNDIIYAHPHRQHMSFLHSFNFMTMNWHADHRTLIELYQYWWMQFQSFSFIKETVSRKDTSTLLDYYFDDLRKFPLLTEEEEFWCLLRVKPRHYTVNDPNYVPRYRYSAFVLGFFDKFVPLFQELLKHWTDTEVPGHILLQSILADVLTLQSKLIIDNTFSFKQIKNARSHKKIELSELIIRVIASLYLLPREKINDMYGMICNRGSSGLRAILMDHEYHRKWEQDWIRRAYDRISSMHYENTNLLVRRNLRLVISIASRYYGYLLEFEDIIEEGNLGLMRAIPKFNLFLGNRFSTYAYSWIRQAITRAIPDKGRLIRLPVHLHDEIARIKKKEEELTQKLFREPTAEEIAGEIGLPIKKVKQCLLYAQDRFIPLEELIGDSQDSELGYFIEDEKVIDPVEFVSSKILKGQVQAALAALSDRERHVLELRYGLIDGKVHTLEEVGRYFNVTRERIRQIEAKALGKLRNPKQSHLPKEYL